MDFTGVTDAASNNQNNPSAHLTSYDSDSLAPPHQLQQAHHSSQNQPQVYHSPQMQVTSSQPGIHPLLSINPQHVMSSNSYFASP